MDNQKIKLKLENISQSYIVDDKVIDAVIDVSFSERKLCYYENRIESNEDITPSIFRLGYFF